MCVFGILEKFQKKTKCPPFEKFCPSSNRFRSGHPALTGWGRITPIVEGEKAPPFGGPEIPKTFQKDTYPLLDKPSCHKLWNNNKPILRKILNLYQVQAMRCDKIMKLLGPIDQGII